MQKLAVAKVNGHMSNPLLGLVHSSVCGCRRASVAHEEYKIPSLQFTQPVHIRSFILDPGTLGAGIARQCNACPFNECTAHEIRAVKRSGGAAVRAELVRRAQIFHPGIDHSLNRCVGGRSLAAGTAGTGRCSLSRNIFRRSIALIAFRIDNSIPAGIAGQNPNIVTLVHSGYNLARSRRLTSHIHIGVRNSCSYRLRGSGLDRTCESMAVRTYNNCRQ